MGVWILVLIISTFNAASGVSISDVGHPFVSEAECETAGKKAVKELAGALSTARFVCLKSSIP